MEIILLQFCELMVSHHELHIELYLTITYLKQKHLFLTKLFFCFSFSLFKSLADKYIF